MNLNMPMEADVANILFALISVNDTLPKKKKTMKRAAEEEEVLNDEREGETSLLGIGKNKVTVTAQTYQNYKSELKWWHEFTCVAWNKVGAEWL